jgi:hypothetical protein
VKPVSVDMLHSPTVLDGCKQEWNTSTIEQAMLFVVGFQVREYMTLKGVSLNIIQSEVLVTVGQSFRRISQPEQL